MNRRAFLTDFAGKASACASVLAGHISETKEHAELLAHEISAQLTDLQLRYSARFEAYEKASNELKQALEHATADTLMSCEQLHRRLNQIEMKNAFMVVWLLALTMVSGVDVITPFISQIHALV